MSQSRGCAASDYSRSLVNERVIRERRDHKQSEVDPASAIALEDGVTDVPTPYRQTFALALFEVTATHDCPACVAGEDAAACLDLVTEVRKASEPCKPAKYNHEGSQGPRVLVEAVARD